MCVLGGIYLTTSVGRQPSFLANLLSSLPARPTLGALQETDGSRNVLEQRSEELRVAQKAREGERGWVSSFLTNFCLFAALSSFTYVLLICYKKKVQRQVYSNVKDGSLLMELVKFQDLGQSRVRLRAGFSTMDRETHIHNMEKTVTSSLDDNICL